MSLIRLLHQLTYLLFPPCCVLCEETCQTSCNFCSKCEKNLPFLSHYCRRCAQSLPSGVKETLPCGSCLQSPPPFERTYALLSYEFPIVHLMTDLKFRHQLSHAKALSQLFIPKIRRDWYANQPLPDVIVPIPLHPKRLRERGFNQAVEIAKPIAKALRIPLERLSIRRIKETAMQSTLDADERSRNMQHAFLATKRFTGKTVALLDDVITTGSTVKACSQALKMAGAHEIHVWCAARASFHPA